MAIDHQRKHNDNRLLWKILAVIAVAALAYAAYAAYYRTEMYDVPSDNATTRSRTNIDTDEAGSDQGERSGNSTTRRTPSTGANQTGTNP